MRRYYVTDSTRGEVVECSRRAVAEGVDMIQVREKAVATADLAELVRRILGLAKGTATRVLVNDRLDVALATGADGVHLPADGLPLVDVRPRIGLVGVSTHTLNEALEAERAEADFIVFGPVFGTPGKTAVGIDALGEVASRVRTPVFAIGGITPRNAVQALGAGAAGVAGIRMFQ
jgi:thiamine-phosphate pyrophosphorylase